MSRTKEGDLLWQPSKTMKEQSNLADYIKWLNQEKGLHISNYDDLWSWSVHEIEEFWESLVKYFHIQFSTPYSKVLSSRKMPGVTWFEGARLNYTEHVFRNQTSDRMAIIALSELRPREEISWNRLYRDVASFARSLKKLDIQKGDRVVAFIPNIYEAIVAFLATASIGAIWSSSSPDFGSLTVLDRFKQIEPKILITVDGYRYGGKDFNRLDTVKQIQGNIPSLEKTIVIPYLQAKPNLEQLHNYILWDDFMCKDHAPLMYEQVPFDHPIWVLFSSGTTGLPKAIVHGQGGIILEHLKYFKFHADIQKNDRFFWYTTTGWMMWNMVVGALLNGTTTVLYDGSPIHPSMEIMWDLIEEVNLTTFGTSASFLLSNMNDGIVPKEKRDFSSLRSIYVTASPLPPEGFKWVYDHVKEDIWLGSMSGGTDLCTAFVLHSPFHPVRAGLLQTRGLGADVQSYDIKGKAIIDEVGELVITKPMPSMPVFFWNDPDMKSYKESYFEMYPGVWRHGDWIKIKADGSNQIYGRSDSTINRGGIRIGTSEIYRAIETMEDIKDSLIIDLSDREGNSYMPLFIVLNEGYVLDENLKQEIASRIRQHCSPRHVPNDVFVIDDVPRTLNDKKMEVPIKRILMGIDPEEAVNIGSMKNPEILQYFIQFAEKIVLD